MKETGPKRGKWIRLLAALLGAGAFLYAYPSVGPGLEALLGRATLLSAAFAMPEGTLETLRQRYSPELYEEELENPPQESLVPTAPPSSSLAPASSSPESRKEQGGAASQTELPAEQQGEMPEIPPQYEAPLITTHMTGERGNGAFYSYGAAWIRNYTSLGLEEIGRVLETPASVSLTASKEPQVLIYHTHTTESYEEWDREIYDSRNKWRSQDNTCNMAAVGGELAEELEKRGIGVIHDTTQHDYPTYNGAYDRSAATIQKYLKQYPSIKVAIDVHRDAVLYDDGSTLKVVQEVNSRKAAQLMVIAPCDDGTVGIPGWKENFRFAAEFTQAVEKTYPGLMRPVFFCYRNYNLGMTPDSLLFEFGTNGNTLEEAKYTARLVGPILADYLLGTRR